MDIHHLVERKFQKEEWCQVIYSHKQKSYTIPKRLLTQYALEDNCEKLM